MIDERVLTIYFEKNAVKQWWLRQSYSTANILFFSFSNPTSHTYSSSITPRLAGTCMRRQKFILFFFFQHTILYDVRSGLCLKFWFENDCCFCNATESGWFWKRLSRHKVPNNHFLKSAQKQSYADVYYAIVKWYS